MQRRLQSENPTFVHYHVFRFDSGGRALHGSGREKQLQLHILHLFVEFGHVQGTHYGPAKANQFQIHRQLGSETQQYDNYRLWIWIDHIFPHRWNKQFIQLGYEREFFRRKHDVGKFSTSKLL